MKLIVFSDSHGMLDPMRRAMAQEKPDMILHLGDHDRDGEAIGREFPRLPILCVRGNCDAWSDTPITRVTEVCGVRIFLCHGHTLGVKAGLLRAVYAAKEQNAGLLLFGHTHSPFLEEASSDGEITILNPGSCGSGWPTCGLIELEQGRIVSVRWRAIK